MVEIEGRQLRGRSGWTPYEGWEAIFAETVLLGGELQLRRGNLCGEPIGEDRFHA